MSSFGRVLFTLATGTANYAEVQFEDISAVHASIIGLRAMLAYTSATTSANRGSCIISKDNFTNSYIIHGEPSIRADYSDGSLTNLYFKSVTISAWNTDSDVNNIKVRLATRTTSHQTRTGSTCGSKWRTRSQTA